MTQSNNDELEQLRYQNLYLLRVYNEAKNLVSVKGRYHTEQAFKALEKVLQEQSK